MAYHDVRTGTELVPTWPNARFYLSAHPCYVVVALDGPLSREHMAECDLTGGIEIIRGGHGKCAIVVTISMFWPTGHRKERVAIR
jgi:hypothetical protein